LAGDRTCKGAIANSIYGSVNFLTFTGILHWETSLAYFPNYRVQPECLESSFSKWNWHDSQLHPSLFSTATSI